MNIFNFGNKPKVAPPSDLLEPDFDALEPLVKKYEPLLSTMADSPFGAMPTWVKFKKAFDDVLFLNFESISFYMEKEIYKRYANRKHEFEEQVKFATTYAASCGWVIGREWATNDLDLRTRLRLKSRISTDDVPADAMVLLHKVVYFPYWIFAIVFTDYYNSSYGQRTRHQKNAHLKDTYQSLMNGVLMSFLDGVKSV